MDTVKKRMTEAVRNSGRKGLSYRELLGKSRLSEKERPLFARAVRELIDAGELVEKKRRFYSARRAGLHEAVIDRVNQTFGFAVLVANDQEVFIPGKYLKGALPGDRVQLRYLPAPQEAGERMEGEVVHITAYGDGIFTGVVVVDEENHPAVLPDRFARFPIPVMRRKGAACQPGDKVSAQVVLRGERHSEHRCRILESYGDSRSPAACAEAVLRSNGIPEAFSPEAEKQAERLALAGISPKEYRNRLDLRSEPIFTIDSADSKDLDDAVSLSKVGAYYQLGVHIADVSHYVHVGSALDTEAFARGTSIYYADRVIPMLPKALSNGICSLNPNEDRLAFSALLTVSETGELLDFDFRKTIICSRVKGVYSEINQILDHRADEALLQKYAGLLDSLSLMKALAEILARRKRERGAPEIETNESKILIAQDGTVADIRLRERGQAERIIEEFMLLANQAAATLGRKLGLPFVYRVHEAPDPERIEHLKEILHSLGLTVPALGAQVQSGQLANVLEIAKKEKDGRYKALVNACVLRSMAKAKYSEEPLGHFGLVLGDYAHFTSPIRRYPDLAIHRILSLLVSHKDAAAVQKKYLRFAPAAALQSTRTELRAVQVERDCEDCYKAAYMAARIGQEFEGTVSSAAAHGIYVELPNTVEGLIRLESLGEGYSFDGLCTVKNPAGTGFRIGDPVKVVCRRADVNSGQIDFELAAGSQR